MDENAIHCDLRQNDLDKEGLHLMSQNVKQQSSKSSKHTGRSRTPDLKDMTTLSHGIIEKSKTTGNLLVDQCNSDFENVTKDRIKNYNTDNSLNIRRYNEEHKYLSDRQKEIEKKTEDNSTVLNENLQSSQANNNDNNENKHCSYQKDHRLSTQDSTEKIISGKKRSQSQSPPSPKKLPITNSETNMSPKNDIRNDRLNSSSNSDHIEQSIFDNARKSNLSQTPITFELGPPNESFSASLGNFIRKNEDELRENLSCFSNYSGPASLDLTKDISVSLHRSADQSRLTDETRNLHCQTATDASIKSSKNSKHSSQSSSGSSGNLVNPSTGPSSLISFESGTSMSNDSVGHSQSTNGKPGKKKSWYNALYPTYKSRAEDFKKIFSALPQEEKLIVEYSCALQRDILVHGRLYVTKNYLCFYANIFRWETSVALRWKDVVGITKEKTALVIPNAIQICTENDERHFFTSFAARDRTYMMLFKLWQNALLDQPASSSEIWRWVHSVYGDELGLTSEDDADYICPTRITLSSLNDNSPPLSLNCGTISPRYFTLHPKDHNGSDKFGEDASFDRNLTYDIITSSEPKTRKKEITTKKSTGELDKSNFLDISDSNEEKSSSKESRNNRKNGTNSKSQMKKSEEITDINSDEDSLENLKIADISKASPKTGYSKKLKKSNNYQSGKKSKTNGLFSSDNQYDSEPRSGSIEEALGSWKTSQEGREIVSQVFPVSVDVLFALLFNNSKFYNEFQESRKTFDMVLNEWEALKSDTIHYTKKREISFTLSLTHPMGPKHSRVTETQRMRRESETGLIYFVDVDTMNAGIPYADSFCVELSYCISKYNNCAKPVKSNNWRSKSHFSPGSQLTVFASIKYKKTVWGLVKTFIEKNTWAGLEEFFLNLAQSLHIECEEKVQKERLSLLTPPGIKNERINENNSDKHALEADDDGQENSDKDVSECSVSQLQKEFKNTSMTSGSSKGSESSKNCISNISGSDIKMEIKEPELSNAIQGASHRIYNEMLKNTDNISENETFVNNRKIEDVKKMSASQLANGNDYTQKEVTPETIVEIQISDLSDCTSMPDQIRNKQSRHLDSYKLNEGNRLSQKNAICYHDLSEGEVVASKLNDYRLVKGMSKSVGNNLDYSHQLPSNEEDLASSYSFENQSSRKEIITRLSQPNNDSGAILESSSKYPDIANNAKEDFKNKRKRTNSIFQIEKHTENKIVKGWNQMINDLTPKMSNVYPIPAQYSDMTPNQADRDDKGIQSYSNKGRRKNNVLSLPQIDTSHIEFRDKSKMPRNEITVSTRGTAHNGIEFQNHIANPEKTRAAKITNVNLTRLGNVPENITPQLLILENDPTVTKEKAVAKSRQKNPSYSNQHLKGKSLQQRNTISTYFSSLISLLSSFTVNEILIKVILTLLTGLLLSNSILFYKLWNLEEKLIEQPVNTDYFDFFNDYVSSTSKTGKNVANSMSNNPPNKDESSGNMNHINQNTDWLKLLHRQEVAHQLELEKWHAILGAATDLLRKTEESLTNLQRNIHPLALKNLRSLLEFNDKDWSSLINDLKNKEVPKSESTKINSYEMPEAKRINDPLKSSSQDETKDSNQKNEL